jgi:hypothetical protein
MNAKIAAPKGDPGMSKPSRIFIPLTAAAVLAVLASAPPALEAQAQSPKVLGFKKQFKIEVRNAEPYILENHPVVLFVEDIRRAIPDFNSYNYAIFEETERAATLVLSQADDLDKDRYHDEIVFIRTLPASSVTTLTCYYAPKGSFQLMTPAKAYARLFGPSGAPAAAGWESDLCAFRFADGRIEPYGKANRGLVLKTPGAAESKPQDWGMKILEAAPSAGLGGLSLWDEGKRIPLMIPDGASLKIKPTVVVAGPLRAMVKAEYTGIAASQPYEATLFASAFADNQASRQDVVIAAKGGPAAYGPGVKKLASETVSQDARGGILSVWGRGTGAADEIGLAVIFDPDQFLGFEETATDRWVKLTGKPGVKLTHWILSGWIKGLGAPAYPPSKNWTAKAGEIAKQVRARVTVGYKTS